MRANDTKMKTPYGLEVIESCLTCPVMKDRLFCDLSQKTLAGLDAISTTSTYPKSAVLFVEGQEARGVFIICNGRVKLSASSSQGKSIILRICLLYTSSLPCQLATSPGTCPSSNRIPHFKPIQQNLYTP